MQSNVNYIGAKVLFDTENEEVCSPEFINMMHRDRKLVWANAIVFDWRCQLSAKHSDDVSLTVSPDNGWGRLSDRGFDIITKQVQQIKIFLPDETGRFSCAI